MVKYIKQMEEIQASEGRNLEQNVSAIINNVRKNGDSALKEYTEKFDGIAIQDLRVSSEEIQKAMKGIPATLLEDIKFSIERIKAFAEAQRRTLTEFEQEMIPGVYLGQKVIPIESVGAYVPGGRYPLLSSAQMAVIPAKAAGVSNIRVATPPTKDGVIHPAVLCAAHLSGADEIYSVGGAQAIAALAYGTETIKPVNKISGPGNRFVTEAKRQVNGTVGIDLLAGPSEVLVVADKSAKVDFIATDLLAQAEHDIETHVVLVTDNEALAHNVLEEIENQLTTLSTAEVARAAWSKRGQIILTENLEESVKVTNDIAPEHLHVQIENVYDHKDKFTNYGSLFLGGNSPVVFADKVCGTNHILPTKGAAKYTGGVWVGTFLKVVTYQKVDETGVQQLAPHCIRQSDREGLIGHRRSAEIRLNGKISL
ncbi:histidinol dehydrogenase [Oceanobacillus halophilus]|uniref:Histidinol dehydrogenase n=1 Tax=Oceanobacillus halophilus TaxID=930130 RepID=A0A494ZT72_9BACI|nr:histidinol dehydrogenase [Oceanobacillus halophilus]RKQ29328.1 histidinol dehydrogenase [Oceanobacillus halophilus]